MKKSIVALILVIVSFNSYAQVFDLIRTIKQDGAFTDDTATTLNNYFISTGTLEIYDKRVVRTFHTCEYNICKYFILTDEILALHPSNQVVFVFGDSGDMAMITILSMHPTLILMQQDANSENFRIDEYKLRQ